MSFSKIEIHFRYGIELVGISADGDPKLLAAMRYVLDYLSAIVIQDSTHVATKLRNRLLNKELAMGTSKVSIDHLKSLVKNIQKSVHGLSQNDVNPTDRMNFQSFRKIVENRVIEALQHIPNSAGTIQYLNICNDVTSSFSKLDMTPSERLLRMWRSVFFLRIWRKFILSSKAYTLGDHFITTNAYMCIEINARNLIVLMKKFRDSNTPKEFLPTLFDSQSCEEIFRHFRSMGTAQYTKINFSLYDLLNMISRVEAQNDISYFKLQNTGISFPHVRQGKTTIYQLPSDSEIKDIMITAKEIAIIRAKQFGMTDVNNIDDFEIVSNLVIDDNENDFEFDEDIYPEDIENENIGCGELQGDESIEENSPFTAVYDEDGVQRIVRKSTLLWMLCEPSEKLSKDRLRRVQVNQKKRKF